VWLPFPSHPTLNHPTVFLLKINQQNTNGTIGKKEKKNQKGTVRLI